jgi:hypothetical protein
MIGTDALPVPVTAGTGSGNQDRAARLGTATAAELRRLRHDLEDAADTISAEHPAHAGLCQALEAVLAEQERRRTRRQDRQPR